MYHTIQLINLLYFSVQDDTFLGGNVILDTDFQPFHNDRNSQDYKNLQSDLEIGLRNTFCGENPDCIFSITSFRKGSVIANFLIAVASDGRSKCDIKDHLISSMSNIPTNINGIPISPGTFSTGKSTK